VSIRTDYFVKFGDPDDLWPELQTQSYIFDYARSNPHPDAPHILQVLHHFGDSSTKYLVMEFIMLTAAPLDLIDRTAQALVWLSNVPPPPNHVIGPLGVVASTTNSLKTTWHLCFSQVSEALQRYMRKVHPCFQFSSIDCSLTCNLGQAYTVLLTQAQKQLSPVEICNDRLIFTQSDMHPSNFGVDQHGKMVLMDFVEIGLLPETFVVHTMFSERCLIPIARALSLSSSSNVSGDHF
jgi:hypothetical protein